MRTRSDQRRHRHGWSILDLSTSNARQGGQARSAYVQGAIYGTVAPCIWASFIVVSRPRGQTSLTPWDVAAVRFTVATCLLLPVVARKGLAVNRLGWTGVTAIIVGCGAPMVLLVNGGFAVRARCPRRRAVPRRYAPHGPDPCRCYPEGGVPNEELGWSRGDRGRCPGNRPGREGAVRTVQTIGHAMFLLAGLAWAGYTVAVRRARLAGLHAAAIAAVGSLAFYLPIFVSIAGTSIFTAPVFDIALQAVVQGVLTAAVALLLYGRMVSLLGATSGAAFVALTPVMSGLMGIPVLGEWPSPSDWMAILFISLGIYVVSGGPLRIASWSPRELHRSTAVWNANNRNGGVPCVDGSCGARERLGMQTGLCRVENSLNQTSLFLH
jgi:drug/metabolite transporter (DMT)-like permease